MNEVSTSKAEPTTEVEILGSLIFGEEWPTEILAFFKKIDFNSPNVVFDEKVLEEWKSKKHLPLWVKNHLADLINGRINELNKARDFINNLNSEVKSAIDNFIFWNKITPGMTIYTQLFFKRDEFGNDVYEAKITLNREELVEGYSRKLELLPDTHKDYLRDILFLRENLTVCLEPMVAIPYP